jgi:hypothetical protein
MQQPTLTGDGKGIKMLGNIPGRAFITICASIERTGLNISSGMKFEENAGHFGIFRRME